MGANVSKESKCFRLLELFAGMSNVMAEVGSALASDAFLVAAAQDDLLLP